jgi:hypothetical protein
MIPQCTLVEDTKGLILDIDISTDNFRKNVNNFQSAVIHTFEKGAVSFVWPTVTVTNVRHMKYSILLINLAYFIG